MNQREMEKKIWGYLLNSEELNNTNEAFVERMAPTDVQRRRFDKAMSRVIEIIRRKAR